MFVCRLCVCVGMIQAVGPGSARPYYGELDGQRCRGRPQGQEPFAGGALQYRMVMDHSGLAFVERLALAQALLFVKPSAIR